MWTQPRGSRCMRLGREEAYQLVLPELPRWLPRKLRCMPAELQFAPRGLQLVKETSFVNFASLALSLRMCLAAIVSGPVTDLRRRLSR